MNLSSLVSVIPEYFLGTAFLLFLIISVFTIYRVFEFQAALGKALVLVLLTVFFLGVAGLSSYSEMFLSYTASSLPIFFKQADSILYKYFSFNFSISQDTLNNVVKTTLYIFSILYIYLIADFLKDQKITSFEYYIIILFALLGLLVLCSSNDLLQAYVSIELSGVAFYILAAYRKKLTYSIDAGIKYFITGAMSSGFFLLGSSFIYALEGSVNFSDFLVVVVPHEVYFSNSFGLLFLENTVFPKMIVEANVIHRLLQQLNFERQEGLLFWNILEYFFFEKELFCSLELGLSMVLFSLFIKLGLSPFHLWTIDVYEGAPTSSTIFFAVITKVSVFVLIVRLFSTSLVEFLNLWQSYFIGVGLLSILVGSFCGIVQRRVKILLAYSSISNMGFTLILLSSNGDFVIWFTIIYLIVYMIASFSVWSIVFVLQLKTQYSQRYTKDLGDFGLLKSMNVSLAYCFAIALFSLAGTPPLIGFISKFAFFISAFFEYSISVLLMLMLFSVISAFYYIRVVKCVFFENSFIGNLYKPLRLIQSSLLSLITLIFIFIFGHPSCITLVGSFISPLSDIISTQTC